MEKMPAISNNSLFVLRKRYLKQDSNGRIIETPDQMFRRVAKTVAGAEKSSNRKKAENEFFEAMRRLDFLPNSPTLMNAGLGSGQLSACFVLPIEDSIESIFETLKNMAIIHKSGGGTGFSFSKIRPQGTIVKGTNGVASGPVSFITLFDNATDIIKQGGRRRGANMGVLHVSHPDIISFINAKSIMKLANFNVSVALTDKFMQAVQEDALFDLIDPHSKKVARKIHAKALFEILVANAWYQGDPGVLFIDEINRTNPLKSLGSIESTNPCGEQPLFAYESCNLGSINLSRMVTGGKIDWNRLEKTVQIGVRFLDNVITVNKFPLEKIAQITLANRKIGLGVMGFAEMLIKLRIPYDAKEAVETAEKVMQFVNETARKTSEALGKERGSFPHFKKSSLARRYQHMRNATVTTIAPTGTLSIIAGTSSSIEPLFSVIFAKHALGTRLIEVSPAFEGIMRKEGLWSEVLLAKIRKTGSLEDIEEIPYKIRQLFRTANEIAPDHHVKIQAAFQKYTDNAVSKTVNLPVEATKKDVEKVFLLAHELKCKGITVYRQGSMPGQVIEQCEVCEK